tara:strand:- start:234 stop:650 length:417 start_codon:yes stop_codon:yes gene_type:complete
MTFGFSFGQGTTKTKANQLEIGARFNDNHFYVDAVIPFKKASRLHPSVAIGNGGAMVATYLDWTIALNEANGLGFYYGLGPELYFYNDFNIGVAGDFGIEYAFKAPITIGFDWRPGFVFSPYDFHTGNWGFIVRYRFN